MTGIGIANALVIGYLEPSVAHTSRAATTALGFFSEISGRGHQRPNPQPGAIRRIFRRFRSLRRVQKSIRLPTNN